MKRPAALIALFVIAGTVVSTQSGRQNKKQAGQRQQQPETIERGTETAPVVVKVLPVPPTKEQTEEKAAERKRQDRADDWTFRFALATVLVGLLQAYIYWKQARSLRDTIAKMDEIAKAQATDMATYIAQTTRFATGVEGIVTSMDENLKLLKGALAINEQIAKTNADNLKLASTAVLSIQNMRQVQRVLKDGTTELNIYFDLCNTGSIPAEVSHVISKSGIGQDMKFDAGWSRQPVGEIFSVGAKDSFVHTLYLVNASQDELNDYAEGRLIVTLRVLAFITNPLSVEKAQAFGRRLLCGPNGATACFIFNPDVIAKVHGQDDDGE